MSTTVSISIKFIFEQKMSILAIIIGIQKNIVCENLKLLLIWIPIVINTMPF